MGIIFLWACAICTAMYFITKRACINALRGFEIREKPREVKLRGFLDSSEERQKCEAGDVVITSNYDYGLVIGSENGYPTKVITCPSPGNGVVLYQDADKATWYWTGKKMSESEWMQKYKDESVFLSDRRDAMDWYEANINGKG